MDSKLTYTQVREAALCLKEDERSMLIEEMQQSLEKEEEISPEFKATLDRRFEEMVTGKVKGIPFEEALNRIDQRLDEARAKRNATSRS